MLWIWRRYSSRHWLTVLSTTIIVRFCQPGRSVLKRMKRKEIQHFPPGNFHSRVPASLVLNGWAIDFPFGIGMLWKSSGTRSTKEVFKCTPPKKRRDVSKVWFEVWRKAGGVVVGQTINIYVQYSSIEVSKATVAFCRPTAYK